MKTSVHLDISYLNKPIATLGTHVRHSVLILPVSQWKMLRGSSHWCLPQFPHRCSQEICQKGAQYLDVVAFVTWVQVASTTCSCIHQLGCIIICRPLCFLLPSIYNYSRCLMRCLKKNKVANVSSASTYLFIH